MSSFFNYPITRPYPYKWFTPVTIVGGICLLSLLSVLNFVQNSYILSIQYANNPNATITNGVWFQDWPSYITRTVQPTCEPANLPLNTQFFTNQSGLTWTLTSVYNNDSSGGLSPSLTYMNNVLDDCKVQEIQMEFDGTQDRLVAVSELTPWDIQVRVFATCGIWTPTGYTFLNVTAMYDPIQSFPVAGSSAFVATDPSVRASMYWAQVLLSGYWVATVNKIDGVTFNLSPPPVKGVATLYPIHADADINGPSFFNLVFDFLSEKQQGGWGWHGPLEPIDVYIQDQDVSLAPEPQIWARVDQLAKSMYAAALTDLGQVSLPARANIVTNATTIQAFSEDLASINETSVLYFNQLATQSYNSRQASDSPTGPLGLTASVIVTKYLCQVPRRKPIGDILISVLLADLVLLSAAWKLFTVIVNSVLRRRDESSKCCEGCFIERIDEEEAGLTSISVTNKSSKDAVARSTRSRTHNINGSARHHQRSRRLAWLR